MEALSLLEARAPSAEAKLALEAGTPLIAKLKDERDWRSTNAEACVTPKQGTDCDGVFSYLAAQPAGSQVAEAHDLLTKARPRLAALGKAEEQRARDEEARAERDAEQAAKQEKRRQFELCKKETCLAQTCFSLAPGRFEVCMDRCVRRTATSPNLGNPRSRVDWAEASSTRDAPRCRSRSACCRSRLAARNAYGQHTRRCRARFSAPNLPAPLAANVMCFHLRLPGVNQRRHSMHSSILVGSPSPQARPTPTQRVTDAAFLATSRA